MFVKMFLLTKNFKNYFKTVLSDHRKLLVNVIQSGINFKKLRKTGKLS